jgi:hypothetical protein
MEIMLLSSSFHSATSRRLDNAIKKNHWQALFKWIVFAVFADIKTTCRINGKPYVNGQSSHCGEGTIDNDLPTGDNEIIKGKKLLHRFSYLHVMD